MPKLPVWRAIAFVFGSGLVGIEITGAVEYLLKQEGGHISYIVAGGAVVTAAASFLPWLASRAWQAGHQGIAVCLLLAMLPALSLIVTSAIERTGAARDATVLARQAVADQLALAKKAEHEAKDQLDKDEAAAADECKSGRGPKCTGLEQRADESRTRLQAARAAITAIGPEPIDPQARRIAAILPVTVEQVELYQPIILPVTVSLLGMLLLSAAFAASRGSGRRLPKLEPAPMPAIKSIAEPSMRTHPARIELPSRTPPRLVHDQPPAVVLFDYMHDRFERRTRCRVEFEALYRDYVDVCRTNGRRTLTPEELIEPLAKLCQECGIPIRREGEHVYLVGVRIAPTDNRMTGQA
jgi:hypothetical protein